jgi:FlaA1/EpsC-like NDP-sugar epimerase
MLRKINILPRWIIFFLDLFISATAFVTTNVIIKNFYIAEIHVQDMLKKLALVLVVNAIIFLLLKSYAGIIRFSGQQDALRVFLAVLISGATLNLTTIITDELQRTYFNFSLIEIIIYTLFSLVGLITYRNLVKYAFTYFRNYKLERKQVIIYGAGEAGLVTQRILSHDRHSNVHIVAFIDDNVKKVGKAVDGVKIYPSANLKKLAKSYHIDEIIIATFTLPVVKRNTLVEWCLEENINVLNIPSFEKWIDGEFSTRQLQAIKIENLLERDPIQINNELIAEQLFGKRVLVTGAAGSIGSEIVRQLIPFQPESIMLVDQAETPLHNLEIELADQNLNLNFTYIIADVRNEYRMEEIIAKNRPHYVYHAAAYKHVPMMERFPAEAVLTNVKGTQNLVNLAVKYDVERFVMVSTDKAVNPTNIMGASKRLAEIYVQWMDQQKLTSTKLITTRFGNVLGSNGSVIHRFKEQIENGGPLTVTHPEITRYFMTIPEACQLVLEAGSMGNGGEIFVFDMGESIKISDLAKKMIRLYGLIPNQDIAITYTGLRPGEKLYEELLNDNENTLPTYHHKITIAKVKPLQMEALNEQFEHLVNLANNTDELNELVVMMKELVPEFVSNNSVYKELDEESNQVKSGISNG